MRKAVKKTLVCWVVLGVFFLPFGAGPVSAAEPVEPGKIGVEQMVTDLLLLRPLGIAATAVGAVFFTVALPFSALGGNTRETYEKLVKEPARFTFLRPLGDF